MDVNVRRCKCTETKEKICRKKERKKDRTDVKERQCGCTDVIYYIDAQMCGCGEVER